MDPKETKIQQNNVNTLNSPSNDLEGDLFVPKPHKTRVKLPIMIAVLVVLILAGIGGYYKFVYKAGKNKVQIPKTFNLADLPSLPEFLADDFLEKTAVSGISQRYQVFDESGIPHTMVRVSSARTTSFVIGKYQEYFSSHGWKYTLDSSSPASGQVLNAVKVDGFTQTATIKVKEDKQVFQTAVSIEYFAVFNK